ncbi:MAG: hypothetical protein KAJ40_02560 [Alphaproteobacteria bacterium]|nr:hypothetical protein [Alphaproteobacteria bacterium]
MTDTKLKKGRKKTGGRKKGTPNKTTTTVKEAIMNAFDKLGGEEYLVDIAKQDHKTFCSLLGRVLPKEISASIETDLSLMTDEELDTELARLRDE